MKALLTNYRQSPRKVRLIADMIRGKSVMEAKAALMFAPQKSSEAIEKLLDSAVSNARQQGAAAEQLFVKTISVDKGTVMRRFSPKARGRAGAIRKTMSIVKLELGNRGAPAGAAPKKAAKAEKAEKAPAKKRAAKKASK
jgi:large subunit ribosomal protein L22